ncbi:MAG TPA: DUF222 domain-containing protein [Marmoricola sp.]|nr:DUF222 domain-containing protein [Marmoricola sp.]
MLDSSGAHPVLACVQRVAEELAGITDVPVEYLGTSEKADTLVALTAVAAQLDALRLRLLAAADDVAARDGARDPGAWLAHETRGDRREQQRDHRLGAALADRWHHLAVGLASGTVNLAQARVITHALDALPDHVPADVVASAETQLVGYAADFGPSDLRVLGRRILDVVAPEIADEAEARALEAEERHAAEHTTLTLTSCGDGTTRLQGRLPDAAAHRLATYLDAFTSPRRGSGRDSVEGPGPIERRRGQAFCALLEHLDPATLPDHGGDATTVMVTMTLDQLRGDLATAGVISSDDLQISAGQARRLACTAQILPVVLGTNSEILDLGRTSRLYSRAQRKAMRIRDRRCRARGCTVPATWCEAHHLTPWAHGGKTDLDDGVLLCSFHHHRAHDDRYDVTRTRDGDLEFRRRTERAA